jgi:ParB-like chromosome segregation protein Spo0J
VAARINAGDVGRGEVFFIDPQEIIVDEKLNGRWTPHDAEAVEDMAKSFEAEGQLQPVQIRKVADNKKPPADTA